MRTFQMPRDYWLDVCTSFGPIYTADARSKYALVALTDRWSKQKKLLVRYEERIRADQLHAFEKEEQLQDLKRAHAKETDGKDNEIFMWKLWFVISTLFAFIWFFGFMTASRGGGL